MRKTTLILALLAGTFPAAATSAQVATGGSIGTLSPNINSAGQQDISAGATVVGMGPGGGMHGGQVPEGIGANWTTINIGDRSMGSTITGTGQFARGAMAPGVGSNFTTVNGQDQRNERGAVTFQFGQPNQQLPYGPGANINTAAGRDLGLESAVINGGSNGFNGGGWRMNGLAPRGVGSNVSTVPGGNLGAERATAAVTNGVPASSWPSQVGGRTFARGTVNPEAQASYALASSWAGNNGNRFFGSAVNGGMFTNYGTRHLGNGISRNAFFYGNGALRSGAGAQAANSGFMPSGPNGNVPARGPGAQGAITGFTPSGFNGNGWNPSAMNAGFVPSGVNGGGWIPAGYNGNPFVPGGANVNGFIPSGYNGNGG